MPLPRPRVRRSRAILSTHGRAPREHEWTAIVARDAAKRGAFVIGVTTTGICCRPGCPARTPNRDSVRVFDTLADAERGGFRPCRRCRPADVDHIADRIARVCRHIDAHSDRRLTLAQLARVAGTSALHLQKQFKAATGVTPRAYADARRMDAFRHGLRRGGSITQAIADAGYGSSSRAYERTPTRLGMTPSDYRDGGRGRRIRFATTTTPIGVVLVASTARGICAVRIGSSAATLVEQLQREFAHADVTEDRAGLAGHLAAVATLAAGRVPTRVLPLDIRATAFQQRVWTALQRIPVGETRSYADVARTIGRETAVRAVARACADNPVALVVPCHRVVRSDGSPGGYRWGGRRKARLLASEKSDLPCG